MRPRRTGRGAVKKLDKSRGLVGLMQLGLINSPAHNSQQVCGNADVAKPLNGNYSERSN